VNPFMAGSANEQVVRVRVFPRLKVVVVSQVVNNSRCPVESTRLARRSSSGK